MTIGISVNGIVNISSCTSNSLIIGVLYFCLLSCLIGCNRVRKSRHVTCEILRYLALPGTTNKMALSIVNWAKYCNGQTKLNRKSEASVES